MCFPHALLMNFEEQIKDSLPGSANGADKQQWQSKINLIELPKGTPTIAILNLINKYRTIILKLKEPIPQQRPQQFTARNDTTRSRNYRFR